MFVDVKGAAAASIFRVGEYAEWRRRYGYREGYRD
jgi:hypothetical protein